MRNSALVVLAVVAWLGLPAVAFADDCSDTSAAELPSCVGSGAAAAAAAAAIGAAGAATALNRKPRRLPPKAEPKPSTPKPPTRYDFGSTRDMLTRPRGEAGPYAKPPPKAPPPDADGPWTKFKKWFSGLFP